jgi:hypothetical protein
MLEEAQPRQRQDRRALLFEPMRIGPLAVLPLHRPVIRGYSPRTAGHRRPRPLRTGNRFPE